MAKPKPKESDLYAPVKAHLTANGYEVKGEVGAVDVMGRRGADDIVIVELKSGFSLALVHQAIARQAITDLVYVCVPLGSGRVNFRALKANVGLCRRLGIGVMTVRMRDGFLEVHCEPGPFRPKKSPKRKQRLTREFDRLQGDPNDGGATRLGIVTGYRQDALRCAAYLAENGPTKGATVAREAGVPVATRLMADNHYGWFSRVQKGVYTLTHSGREGLVHWAYSWEPEAD